MGMFSEIHAEATANAYKEILIEAIKSQNTDIIKFCHEHIYEKYKFMLSEAFVDEDMAIKNFFN